MSLNAKKFKQESKYKPADPLDPGTYPARVVQILALGLQKQRPFKGEPKDPKYELYVTYELLDEFLKDEDGNEIEDKPRWQSESFPMNSLDVDLAKSTKRYVSLDPEMKYDGDWAKLIGTPCMVTIVQNPGKGDRSDVIYNNVASVQTMRAKEASKAPELVNEGKVFDIDEPDMEVFFSLPEWLQNKMKENLDYAGSALEKAVESHKGSSGGEGSQKKEEAPQTASQGLSEESDDEDDW